jgi:hypothetical protein
MLPFIPSTCAVWWRAGPKRYSARLMVELRQLVELHRRFALCRRPIVPAAWRSSCHNMAEVVHRVAEPQVAEARAAIRVVQVALLAVALLGVRQAEVRRAAVAVQGQRTLGTRGQ